MNKDSQRETEAQNRFERAVKDIIKSYRGRLIKIHVSPWIFYNWEAKKQVKR